MHPPQIANEWATFLAEVTFAGAGFAAVLSVIFRLTIGRRLERIEKQLRPNGSDKELPEDDRGVELRTLVLRSRRDIIHMKGRLDDDTAWMTRHEREHVRRDASWPAENAPGL